MKRSYPFLLASLAIALLATPGFAQTNRRNDSQRNDRQRNDGEQSDRRSNDHDDQPREYRSADGSGNNKTNPTWGAHGVDLLRVAPADYGDGVSTPAGADRKSAREISNLVLAQEESIVNDRHMTDMVWQWGQFVDHDIDITENADPLEEFSIPVPTGDEFFDPQSTGDQTISLFRSTFNPSTAPRQQINDLSSYIDGSNVYGDNEETANELRSFEGGKLKTSQGDLLPVDDFGFFIAGDIRVNEQAYLTCMHTLFMREHNRIAEKFAEKHDNWNDERLYKETRRIVIAELQAITFNEFLPTLLGENAIRPYRGYKADVNAGIANSFSTAFYRLGHSMLSSELLRLNNDGEVIAAGNLALRDAFFNPDLVKDEGIEPYLKGLTAQECQELDSKLIDDIRNFLFGQPGQGGFDLGSLNIQRGRDHGLPSYNAMRVVYGLEPVEAFDEISTDESVQLALFEAYEDVDKIDLWVGALAEDHVRGASVGPLLQRAIARQFENLRDGDRFWYETSLEGDELERVKNTKLSDIIRRNTTLTNVPDNVFVLGRQGGHGSKRRRGDDRR